MRIRGRLGKALSASYRFDSVQETDQKGAAMNDQPDNPGVVALPPVIYLVFFVAGLALDQVWPLPLLADPLQYGLGSVVSALSGGIAIWTIRMFRGNRTPFDVRKPTSTLIMDGPFRYSRNPGYLALTMLYAGLAIVIDSLWAMMLLVPTLFVMHYGAILREEQYLERKFGETYRNYKASVRRWI